MIHFPHTLTFIATFPKTSLQAGSYFGFILATVTEDLLFRKKEGRGVGKEKNR